MAKKCSTCYSLFYIRYWMSKKGKTNHEKSCQSILFRVKTDYLHSETSYKNESACLWKQLKWKRFPCMETDCRGKNLRGINVTDSVSEKGTQEEQSLLIRRQAVWKNYSEQMTEKQNSVKTCTNPRKRKLLPYMEIGVTSTEKRNVVHIKHVWIS